MKNGTLMTRIIEIRNDSRIPLISVYHSNLRHLRSIHPQ